MITYHQTKTKAEILQIIELQENNLPTMLTHQEMSSQGFVTVKHSFDLLFEMNTLFGHIIAKQNNALIGYALVMTNDFRHLIPVLIPMFKKIDKLNYKLVNLNKTNYFIMGQICITKDFRGQGIFYGLYNALKKHMASHFDYVITEIDKTNTRSLKAHLNQGFKSIFEYADQEHNWVIMLWDWKS